MAYPTSYNDPRRPIPIPSAVSLIPAVEIPPYLTNYAAPEQNRLTADGDVLCLSSAGGSELIRLYPIEPGWWHIPIDQLNNRPVLKLLVGTRIADEDDEQDGEAVKAFPPRIDLGNILALDGGFALCIDGQVMITPRCCSDLADIDHWESACDHRSTDKAMVWIGHPWIDVRFDGSNLVFTEADEEPPRSAPEPGQADAIPQPQALCAISPDALRTAIDQARRELAEFCKSLIPVVEPLVPPGRAIETARALAGL